MYIYSRRRRVNPAQSRAGLAKTVELAGMASSITGFEVSPWTTVLSADVGLVQMSFLFDHLVDYELAVGKLRADGAFGDALEAADGLFQGPAEDILVSLLSGPPEEETSTPMYVSSVRTQLANGQFAAGVAGGLELASEATRITGSPMLFGILETGPYGGVVWITSAPDLATIEQNLAAVANDPGWLSLVDRVGPCYQAQNRRQTLRRLS